MLTTISKRNRLVFILAGVAAVLLIIFLAVFGKSSSKESMKEISPAVGNVSISISATGTIQPENRLEVKPPVGGRIINILVKEGDKVKEGQLLAWMSSTERAAILDAARAKGEAELRYWEDSYKPTPIISPINGEVIVSTDQPGQTVTASEAIIVLSDHLIVKAQVDETDIGRVKIGQQTVIGLDAYPDIKVDGVVNHISYESTVINNVTTYQVYIEPAVIPDAFRSGMSTNVEIIEEGKQNVMLLPLEAIKYDGQSSYVLLGKKSTKQRIQTGLCDEKNCEIISGLSPGDKVMVTIQKYQPSDNNKPGSNPFMPMGRKK